MYQRWRQKLKSSLSAAREIRRHGILSSINTTRRSPDLCFSSLAILATKTRKRSARKHFYRWSEIYLPFRVEAHFRPGCCYSRQTRRGIIGKKREPRNEVETRCTFQSMQAEPMTNRRLIRHLEILVRIPCYRLLRPPGSWEKASMALASRAGKSSNCGTSVS